MDKLKPCPFCGTQAHIMKLKSTAIDRYFVVCGNSLCIAHEKWVFGNFFHRETDAIKAWNRRVDAENT